MSEEKKKCTYCQRTIKQRKDGHMVKFINITQGSPKLFCNNKCKKAWLSERIEKSQIDGVEWSRDTPIKKKLFDETGNLKTIKEITFPCKYCNSKWLSNRSKIQHERWCDENPDQRTYSNKEASGGEKTGVKVDSTVLGKHINTGQADSKPPEPKHIDCCDCKFYGNNKHFCFECITHNYSKYELREDDSEKDITVKDLIVLGLDTKLLIEEFQRFFRNKDAILKSIDKLVEQWEKEDAHHE